MSRPVEIRVWSTRDIWTDKAMVRRGTGGVIRSIMPLVVCFDTAYSGVDGIVVREDEAWTLSVQPCDIEIVLVSDGDQGGWSTQEPHVNVETPSPGPSPSRRTVRLPAIGQRVGVGDVGRRFEAVVSSLEIDPFPGHGEFWVGVDLGGGIAGGRWDIGDVTPIGDNPRWVEVVLPE